jgi:ribosome maturation factor RimP
MISPELRQAIEAAAERKGTHVIDLVRRGDRGRQVIEVFIDTAEGVTTEVCAQVSREISGAIDAANLILGQYRLDVSSPGIDRPLMFPWQYPKHIGRLFRVKVRTGDVTEEIEGFLIAASGEGIRLQVKGKSEPVDIALATIVEARVPAPW